ncbi:MAG: sterol desaturase [Candidatus Marinimicrobia bacterium]|nr:sterol desaturase [Candidatus Neomarinimicrobiota bacterium]|tara:strand:+ start:32855 stop:33697 length:843 start_codon:yes stop_codon:yes gene_type:complete
MEQVLVFFGSIESTTRSIFLISGLALFLSMESIIPLFKMDYNKLNHAGINLIFTLITLIINLFGALLIIAGVNFNLKNKIGILYLIGDLPAWAYVIIGLALLDLIGAWLIHWIEHKVKWMWKFHLIHHTDPKVDATSGLRHHPGENIFRLLFTFLAVIITGASLGLVMLYQTVSAFFAALTHANIRVPGWINKYLSWIIVTPHFHKIHHHYVQPYTDSNYGNIFSVWDHLFKTVKTIDKMDNLVYGIDTHMSLKENSNIKNLLIIPFQEYRNPPGSKFPD